MKRQSLVILGALALAACGGPEGPRAVGQLAWDRIELVAEASEPIVAIEVREGQAVAEGDLLLRLDGTRSEAQVREAASARRRAEAVLAELEKGVRQERVNAARSDLAGAEAALQVAVRDLARVQKLAAEGLVSATVLDQARATHDRARAARDAARARLEELVNGATLEQLQQARAAVAQAQAAERAAGVSLQRLVVRAPQAGRVDALPFELGERPGAGAVVAVMLAGDAPYARVYVPEPVRSRIAPGTRAQVFVDGIEKPFAGAVRRVSSDAVFTPFFALTEHDRERLSFLAEIVLDPTDARLPAGIPVEVVFTDAP